jgi:hypothetical protein
VEEKEILKIFFTSAPIVMSFVALTEDETVNASTTRGGTALYCTVQRSDLP